MQKVDSYIHRDFKRLNPIQLVRRFIRYPLGLLFLALLPNIVTAQVTNRKGSELPIQVQFKDYVSCKDDRQSAKICSAVNYDFRSWTEAEKNQIVQALTQIKWSVFSPAVNAINRLSNDPIIVTKIENENEGGSLVMNSELFIFISQKVLDANIQYLRRSELTHTLTHEFLHFFSYDVLGSDYFSGDFWKRLQKAMDWTSARFPHHFFNKPEVSEAFKKRQYLSRQGLKSEASQFDADFAKQIGFPSLYSLLNIEEFFVELITRLIYEPEFQNDISESLANVVRMTEFSGLVQSREMIKSAPPKLDVSESRRQKLKTPAVFVGRMLLSSQPHCTVFLIRHGMAVTAKHCYKEILKSIAKRPNQESLQNAPELMGPAYVNLEFNTNAGETVYVNGSQIDRFWPDKEKNDWAYIEYNPDLTKSKIKIPKIKLARSDELIAGQKVYSVGYALPRKAQESFQLKSEGTITAQKGSIEERIPEYEGELTGTTMPAWYIASGSPIFTLPPENIGKNFLAADESLTLVAVLSHTFELDQKGRILPHKIQQDSWGSWTQSNFSIAPEGLKKFL